MGWEKAKVTGGKPTGSFKERLEGMLVRTILKTGDTVVDLLFENVGTLTLFNQAPPYEVKEDGTVPGFTALGLLASSLALHGYNLEFNAPGNTLEDARISPDLMGMVVSMKATTRKNVKVEGGKEFTDWTVEGVEDGGTPKARGAVKTSAPPPGDSDALAGEWKVLLAENLEAGITYDEGEVVKLLGVWVPDKTHKTALNKVRGAAFKEMFASGFLKGSLSGFTLG